MSKVDNDAAAVEKEPTDHYSEDDFDSDEPKTAEKAPATTDGADVFAEYQNQHTDEAKQAEIAKLNAQIAEMERVELEKKEMERVENEKKLVEEARRQEAERKEEAERLRLKLEEEEREKQAELARPQARVEEKYFSGTARDAFFLSKFNSRIKIFFSIQNRKLFLSRPSI